jgi:hypothetical protein
LEVVVVNCGRSFLAVMLSLLLLPAVTPGATGKPLGQVLLAERAHVGRAEATVGATVFPGDVLSTEALGKLQVRAPGTQWYLLPHSAATLEAGAAGGTQAKLVGGTVVFSAAAGAGLELQVGEARIRPQGGGPTVGQVTVVGPQELVVISRRGALEFALGAEAEMIPAGAAYRVLLNPPEPAQGAEGVGSGREKAPKKSGRKRRAFLFILFGGAAAATGFAIDEALESPDHP